MKKWCVRVENFYVDANSPEEARVRAMDYLRRDGVIEKALVPMREIQHTKADTLKELCEKHGIPYVDVPLSEPVDLRDLFKK